MTKNLAEAESLLHEVLDYYHGQNKYNFSNLSECDRNNASFDAWEDILQRIMIYLTDMGSKNLSNFDSEPE